MDALKEVDTQIVLWLNQWAGRYGPLDEFSELVVSDYFIPMFLGLALLGLWFAGRETDSRWANQRAVITAVVALGFANLTVLLVNDYYFRPRPFVVNDLTLLFYQPSDSSFPANPAAISFALAFAVWLSRKSAGTALLFLALLWNMSRIYAGIFYPSDALAGALIGVVVTGLVVLALRWLEPLPTLAIRLGRLLHLA
jgi:undecaprenyl-diphosphatase